MGSDGMNRRWRVPLTHADTNKEQLVRAGDYFYESGDVNIRVINRGTHPARLQIAERIPASLKGSAMLR